jgi:uncharacterized protein YecE (DUF72 family)
VARVRVGTSGWSYQHWRDGVFYPPDLPRGRELAYYCTIFDCVEINCSFYHTPRESALRAWREQVPRHFRFAYKASRTITHNRKLVQVEESVAFVLGRARLLGQRLGPILWQFPPRLRAQPERLANFLALLPRDLRHAFEFRHPSWFCEEIYALLRSYNACLVWADAPGYPLEWEVTADFVYARLHGHQVLYASLYTLEELKQWAERLAAALQTGRRVWVFFDNDACGYAPRNALQLRELLGG